MEAAIARYRSLAGVAIEDVVGSRDLFGYRNTAKLAVRRGPRGSLRAGVYEPGSHRLADAVGCAVHHPALNEVLAVTLDEAAAAGVPAYDEERRTGELRYLIVRTSSFTRRVTLIVVTRSRDLPALRDVVARVAGRCRRLGGVVQNVNPDPGNVILGRESRTVRPPAKLLERIGFLRLQASAQSFLQVNLWTARRIYETVVDWAALDAADAAVDVFSGVGPLSLYLATRARLVVGLEETPSAVVDARSNARRNGFGNVRFREGAAEHVLPIVADELERVAVVTLNPPRKGALVETIDAIAALAPRRIVYVSCDPTTLARDLDRLAARGYRSTRVRPFDMLPQTEHVEAVALAERG